jgi:eukaryotic-like serine/threonine-protein kinase
MKRTRILFYFALLILAASLSACGGQTFASWPGFTVNQETAYLAFNQYVYAVSIPNGEFLWRFPAEPERNVSFYAPPALTPEGSLIVGSFSQGGPEAKLYSLDAATGSQQWVFEEASFHYIAKPLVTTNGIYAPNADGTLYALNFNGSLRWKFTTERSLWASPATNETCDCIYVASMDHKLYALDAQTGALDWETQDLGGALAASPVFGDDGVIFIGTSGSQMLALDAESGQQLWAYDSEGWIWSDAAYHQNVLYFGDLDGYLYALDAQSGSERWKIQADGAILSKPLIWNERLFYTTEMTNIYALNLDGTPVWQRETSAKVYGAVVASGDTLIVATTDSENPLIAYNEDGGTKWTFGFEK